MKYKEFGDMGISVSEIGFGAWGIGGTPKDAKAYGPTDDNVSRAALRRAFDKGVTFYDTAPLYGYGHSETLIGQALHDVREKIIIASKVGFINFDGAQDFSPDFIKSSVEESLKRLQTDYIDILQLHYPPLEVLRQDDQIFKTLDILKNEGIIRVIGISSQSPDDSLTAIKEYPFKSIQTNFNFVDQRSLDNGLFYECEKRGVGIIGRTPLCFGFLTGQYNKQSNYDETDHRSSWNPEQIECWANAVKMFVNELDEEQSDAQAALRFCISYPMLSTIIPGMLTPEHVDENIYSSELGHFSPDVLEKFNEIYKNNTFFVKPK